jgi:hypothetical protein
MYRQYIVTSTHYIVNTSFSRHGCSKPEELREQHTFVPKLHYACVLGNEEGTPLGYRWRPHVPSAMRDFDFYRWLRTGELRKSRLISALHFLLFEPAPMNRVCRARRGFIASFAR